MNNQNYSINLDDLASKFLKENRRNKGYFQCPNCGENKFSINKNSLKFDCYSCHDTSAITKELIKMYAPKTEMNTKSVRSKQTQEWIYTDVNNKPLIKVVRVDDGEGKRSFFQKHWNGSSWVNGYGDIKRNEIAIYKYKEVREAIAKGEPVTVVEGEGCADSLWTLGMPATCNIGGSGKWLPEHSKQLEGARGVILAPDRDKPGVRHMEAINKDFPNAKWLYAFPNSKLWNIEIPDNQGLDVKDWIEENDFKNLDQIIESLEDGPRKLILSPVSTQNNDQLSINDAIAKASEILTSIDDELEQNIELSKIQAKINPKVSDYNWEHKYIRPLKQRLKGNRLRLEVAAYLQEEDKFIKVQRKTQICSSYRISGRDLDSLCNTLEIAASVPKSKKYSAAEFLTLETAGIGWIYPGLLPSSGVTLLGGNPGAGKSTLAYDCAAGVIYGENFLTESPVKMGHVLFVVSDEPTPFIQDKLINRGIGENFTVLADWDTSQWAELETAIDDTRPALVIVDSFASIHREMTFDENSTQAKATIYKLNTLSEKYGFSCILTHHLAKSKDNTGVNKFRGSTAIAAASCMTWLLQGEGETKKLTTPKTRGTAPLNLTIKLNPETGIFEYCDGNLDDDITKSNAQIILDFFKMLEPGVRLTFQEIKNQLPLSKETLYKALNRLVKKSLLVKRPSLTDKRIKVWGLPSNYTYPGDHTTNNGHTTQTDVEPPPSPTSVSNVQQYAKNQSHQDIQILGNLLDTSWTGVGQEKGGNAETLTGVGEKLLDTLDPQRGGVSNVDSDVLQNTEEKLENTAPELGREIKDLAETFEVYIEIGESEDLRRLMDHEKPEIIEEAIKLLSKDYQNKYNNLMEKSQQPQEEDIKQLIIAGQVVTIGMALILDAVKPVTLVGINANVVTLAFENEIKCQIPCGEVGTRLSIKEQDFLF